MSRRLELHNILKSIPGVKKAYFQPPESVKLVYPCIVYDRINEQSLFADNNRYTMWNGYDLLVIDPNPDTEIPDRILQLPYTRLDRTYTKDNLNHYAIRLYF